MLPVRTLHMLSSSDSSIMMMMDDDSCVCGQAKELDVRTDSYIPVARIMKIALPDNAKIAKEAKECMQECVSEFISFITSEGTTKDMLLLKMHQLTVTSIREMSAGKAEDSQWGRHPVRYDLAWL